MLFTFSMFFSCMWLKICWCKHIWTSAQSLRIDLCIVLSRLTSKEYIWQNKEAVGHLTFVIILMTRAWLDLLKMVIYNIMYFNDEMNISSKHCPTYPKNSLDDFQIVVIILCSTNSFVLNCEKWKNIQDFNTKMI